MSQNASVVSPELAVMKSVEFSDNERSSVRVVNGFAVISTLALVSVAARIVWLATRRYMRKDPTLPKEYAFFRTQLGNYAVCLLLANLCNCISGLMGIRYTVESGIVDDTYCQAQAVMMQLGNCATAYFTVAMAFHSFASLGLRVRHSAVIGAVTITVGWVGSVLLVTLPTLAHRDAGPLYGISGLSCAVRGVYPTQQFEFHILPIFIASVLSAILYSLIFLVLRGTLKIRDGISLNFNPMARYDMTEGQGYHQFVVSIAHSLVWYPIVYILLMLPYSITLLLAISGFAVPFAVLMIAFVLYFMISVANVLLLYNTFRVLGPAFDSPSFTTPSKSNVIGSLASAFSSKKDLEKDGSTMSWYSQNSQPTLQYSQPSLAYSQTSVQFAQPGTQYSRSGNTSYAAALPRQPSVASTAPRQLSLVSTLSSEKQPDSPEIGSWRVPQPAPAARKAERVLGPVPRYNADGTTEATHHRTSTASSESSLRVLVLPGQQRLAPAARVQTPSVASQDIRGWLARQPGGRATPESGVQAQQQPSGFLPRELMTGRPASPTGSTSSGSSKGSRHLVKPYYGRL